MSADEIRIAVAELRGWTGIHKTRDSSNANIHPDSRTKVIRGIPPLPTKVAYPVSLPNYPASLDACAEFEKGMTYDETWA